MLENHRLCAGLGLLLIFIGLLAMYLTYDMGDVLLIVSYLPIGVGTFMIVWPRNVKRHLPTDFPRG